MKHLIIGVGVVGDATGYILEDFGEEVWYYDVDETKTEFRHEASIYDTDFDIYWICTAEWNVEEVIKELSGTDKVVVVRSTTAPGTVEKLGKEYGIQHIAHVPEFLREKHAREDALNPDRVVIGTTDAHSFSVIHFTMSKLRQANKIDIMLVTPRESEMIKIVSNAYLSAQISFWNEIKWICRNFGLNPKTIVAGVSKDHRVSPYGHSKFGKFSGFCLPKDLATLINISKIKKCKTYILDAVLKVNQDEP